MMIYSLRTAHTSLRNVNRFTDRNATAPLLEQ